jgi:regulator of PEP synthase PpsR (kinase-PPPase family)
MSIAGHVSRAMLSRYSHVRMEAKRRALDEIGARQRAADQRREAEAERREQIAASAPLGSSSWTFIPSVEHGSRNGASSGEHGQGLSGDEVIMSIAGHVSRAMLSRYSHVRMEAKRRALDEIAARQRAADRTAKR